MGNPPQPTPSERQPSASGPEPAASEPGNGEHPPQPRADGLERY
jgi:hypothetical protein